MACFNVTWGLSAVLGARGWPLHRVNSAADDVAGFVDSTELPLVVVVRDAAVHTWQDDVVRRCARTRATVVVDLGWPSDRSWDVAATIVSHGAARASAQAVLELLEGSA